MTRYRIHPAGVERVLRATRADAITIGTLLTPLEGHVESAAAGTGNSGAIGPALQAFFSDQSTLLEGVNRRIAASLTGAMQATQAYVDGDLEMVGDYQQGAVRDALPPQFDRPVNRGMSGAY